MTKYLGIAMMFVGVALATNCASKPDSGLSGQDVWNPVAKVLTAVPGGNDPVAVDSPVNRKSVSDAETLARILREACIAEDFAAMRTYMPSTDEVAQAFSGGHEPLLSSRYSDIAVLATARKEVACPCFASLGDATPHPEMKRRYRLAQGDEIEDGVRASRDIDFARAKIITGPSAYTGPSGPHACFLSFIMVNFGNGWKLLNLDT